MLLVSAVAGATEATVNAAESRKPIARAIYSGNYADVALQAQLAAMSIDLPAGELAKVALLGTFGQTSAAGAFTEGPAPEPTPSPAIALYTNYDGQGGRFGDTSINTVSTNPLLSVFAAFDLDAKVTVVMVNRSAMVSDAVQLGFQGMGQKGTWRAFELGADGQISPAGTGTIYDAVVSRTVKPYTALLIEYRPVGGILPVRATPAPDVIPAARVVEEEAAPQPAGCSSVGFGSMALIGLLGLMRRRVRHSSL